MARRLKVDMTGVESYNKASEGKHVVKIVSIDEKTSQGGNDMLQCCFEVVKGADKGCRVYENYPLIDTALWKLKGMLQAIGMKAEGKISLDLDKLIGKQLIVEVIHEDYNGQERARVSECRKLSSASDEEDEDIDEDDFEEEEEEETPKKKTSKKTTSKKKSTAKKKPDPESEEDDEDEDFDEDDEDEEEEEEKPKKKATTKKTAKKATAKKTAKKKQTEPEEDEDEEDWDEDDEEDWEEA